jgi:outer membrane receptor protein involved in Fe transport
MSVSYKLFTEKELRVRAFYKNIYRLPTFNDLYYKDFGNSNLQPEDAQQYNIGVTYLEIKIPFIKELVISGDAYYNKITNKIIAIPKDLFHWTTVNKGKVVITGIDLNAKAVFKAFKNDLITINTNYSFSKALDKTPNSANYNEQIPYTPVHSGSSSVNYHHKMLDIAYNMIFNSIRWNGQNISTNRLDSYHIHSVQATASWKRYKVSGEIINIFNSQYEVVQFYPMPRRNFRITLSANI